MEKSAAGNWASWPVLLAAVAAAAGMLFQRGNLYLEQSGSVVTASASPTSILEIFARNAFDWTSSTTPAPLSTTAVLVKAILADPRAIPAGLDRGSVAAFLGEPSDVKVDDEESRVILDVHIAAVRQWVSSGILTEVQRLCGSAHGCDPNEIDPEFGTTPLHLAEFWGSAGLAEYLRSLGASGEAFDSVGRQAKNMTFGGFSKYSRMAGRARLPEGTALEERCEIPEVIIPLPPGTNGRVGNEKLAAVAEREWRNALEIAMAEVRRLISEGEPVVARNALPWLLATKQQADEVEIAQPAALKYSNPDAFVQAWGHRPVDVGGVPYAKNFDLANQRTTLRQYIEAATSVAATSDEKTSGQAPHPNYVFQVDTEACVEGRELLGRIVDAALPATGDRPLICPPASGQRGLESVHYYLGGRGTGAPNHIHSDAINLALTGEKKWWVVTPRAAVWSRRHILEFAEECERGVGGAGPDVPEEYRPMQFVQKAGDLVYVPADWGHAAMNLQDNTFGYTLELINRRDTLASVLGQGCEK